MSILQCPKCNSENIGQYRKMTGAIWCNHCGYKVDKKEEDKSFIVSKKRNKVIVKRAICDIVSETEGLVTDKNKSKILSNLKEILNRALAMEDRLVQYRNAIEELGFEREVIL